MKNRLSFIAIVALLCGLASAGFGVWSYYRSSTQATLSRSLEETSFDLETQSDAVKGTPEEIRLVSEARKYSLNAGETLASAKSNSQRAVILGIASIVLIVISIGTIVAHLKQRELDRS